MFLIQGLQCSIEQHSIYKKKQIKMGCSESQLKNLEHDIKHEHRQYAEIKPADLQEDSFEVQEIDHVHLRTPQKKSFNTAEISMISKEKQQNNIDDKDELSKIKVKKAKNYRIRPEHEKFIENILETNRAKAVTQCPPSTSKHHLAMIKKCSTSMYMKAQQLASDKQNAQKQKEGERKEIKNASKDTKYTKKQAQKIVNNIMMGKLNQQELNQIGERIDLEQLDSNATLQL